MMNQVEDIVRDLLGLPLSCLKKGSDVETAVGECTIDLGNANRFERLLAVISKRDFVIESSELVYVVVKLGVRFTSASLVSNGFWWRLMVS